MELRGILGTGAYGVVYSALDHSTGIWYAVKALSKTNPNGEPLDRRQQEFQSREIQLHYAASAHPNIVSMLKIVDDKDCTYVVLEYCPEGDLFSNITEKGRYVSNDALVRRAFLQVIDAVEHCHRLGIYHRDLKPENILVSNSGADVLLADFGLATTDSVSEDHGCGSTFYMSPGRPCLLPPPSLPTNHFFNSSECLDQSSRNLSYRCAPNDVWSLGVILVNLTCGRNPWKQASLQDTTYRAFARNRNFLKTILPLSDELNDILGMIFESNPEDRISVSQLKRRIQHCSRFSAAQQLSTPVSSPITSVSDNGSLPETCASLSDIGSDSGYDSMESDSPSDEEECFEVDMPISPLRPAVPFAHPQTQQYVLPSQDIYGRAFPEKAVVSHPYMVHNTWIQSWFSNGYPFRQPQVTPQAFNSTHYPPYPSHFQHLRDLYAY